MEQPNLMWSCFSLERILEPMTVPDICGNHAGSDSRGRELGYSLSHAFGAVFDNPDLIVACVVGDGEAETGPLANTRFFVTDPVKVLAYLILDPPSDNGESAARHQV